MMMMMMMMMMKRRVEGLNSFTEMVAKISESLFCKSSLALSAMLSAGGIFHPYAIVSATEITGWANGLLESLDDCCSY